jgi:hypothetical protein
MGADKSKNGSVKRVPKAGGMVEPFASAQSHPAGIAADDLNVYWGNEGDNTVMKLAKSGGSPATLTSLFDPLRIDADASGVYVAARAGGIYAIDAGGAAKLLARAPAEPNAMVLDGPNIYFMDDDGNVSSVPKAGGKVTVLAAASKPSMSGGVIAVGASDVFYGSTATSCASPGGRGAASAHPRPLTRERDRARRVGRVRDEPGRHRAHPLPRTRRRAGEPHGDGQHEPARA